MRGIADEKFVLHGRKTAWRIFDFFQWWSDSMMTNSVRGVLAEYIVAMALHCEKGARLDAWGPYDLVTPRGVRVEVKSSAYLQSWKQLKPSRIVFSIKPGRSYDYESGLYSERSSRNSDVYVFCVFESRERDSARLSDLDQWGFYAMRTAEIDRCFGNQKTICLSRLLDSGIQRVAFDELEAAVTELMS